MSRSPNFNISGPSAEHPIFYCIKDGNGPGNVFSATLKGLLHCVTRCRRFMISSEFLNSTVRDTSGISYRRRNGLAFRPYTNCLQIFLTLDDRGWVIKINLYVGYLHACGHFYTQFTTIEWCAWNNVIKLLLGKLVERDKKCRNH